MKILICEDDKAMMSIIEFTIKRDYSVNVDLAIDGKEAMRYINRKQYDLILTDIHMPYHTGLDIIEYVRKIKKYTNPIVVLSIEGFEETVLSAFKLGADDYIVKPFNPLELSNRLKKYFETRNVGS